MIGQLDDMSDDVEYFFNKAVFLPLHSRITIDHIGKGSSKCLNIGFHLLHHQLAYFLFVTGQQITQNAQELSPHPVILGTPFALQVDELHHHLHYFAHSRRVSPDHFFEKGLIIENGLFAGQLLENAVDGVGHAVSIQLRGH